MPCGKTRFLRISWAWGSRGEDAGGGRRAVSVSARSFRLGSPLSTRTVGEDATTLRSRL